MSDCCPACRGIFDALREELANARLAIARLQSEVEHRPPPPSAPILTDFLPEPDVLPLTSSLEQLSDIANGQLIPMAVWQFAALRGDETLQDHVTWQLREHALDDVPGPSMEVCPLLDPACTGIDLQSISHNDNPMLHFRPPWYSKMPMACGP